MLAGKSNEDEDSSDSDFTKKLVDKSKAHPESNEAGGSDSDYEILSDEDSSLFLDVDDPVD